MGIHDRDYYRDETRHWFDAWSRWGVTTWLIVISCLVFLAQMVTRDVGVRGVTEYGLYDPRLVLRGEVWRLLTPIFLSGGLFSLAVNMLTLYWAGSRMEDRYGGREFLLFYLAAGLFAHTAYFLTQVAGLLPEAPALGPRGPILATLVLYACHYPRETVNFNFLIPMPVWLLVVIYVTLDLLASLGNKIPFSVYLAGALFGFLYYRAEFRLSSLVPGLPVRSGRSAPRLRVVPAESEEDEDEPEEPVGAAVEAPPRPAEAADEQFEARVDAVLEKVSKHGQESLTPEEREILFRAGEVYKRRRK